MSRLIVALSRLILLALIAYGLYWLYLWQRPVP